ncbi:MAG: L-glutamate gamma-semialdehyde dehydrogenase [Polyangiaceae bacterium]
MNPPVNEPVLTYAPGSAERAELKAELDRQAAEAIDIPMWIDGAPIRTGATEPVRSPHDHARVIGHAHQGTVTHAEAAIQAALTARPAWASASQATRSAVFLRAAEMIAGRKRATLNASTMLGQSKTVVQAEIDAACELVDFLRFNVHFAEHLLEQPISGPGMRNALESRPLEGFVAAITPFNFTAIAANLPAAPALLGNVVVWKPSPNALHSAHHIMSVLTEAGLPEGVINLVTGPAPDIVGRCLADRSLAGVHFTGSTSVFRSICRTVGENISTYKSYPRLVGETGGKDFIFAHASADLDALAVAMVRGAFEYQGQKCSAASRAYIPRSIWKGVVERVAAHVAAIKVGDVRDFSNFMGAVIDERSFTRLAAVLAEAKSDTNYQILAGGGADRERGFFVHPTFVESKSPDARLMSEEFFGPILTAWVYEDAEEARALEACNASAYALTGAVFGRDRAFVDRASRALVDAAGNFYVNDKPTGAVVGQQPFGGGRASGTNDKAGSALNLLRWVSPRTVKETFDAPRAVGYPAMREP